MDPIPGRLAWFVGQIYGPDDEFRRELAEHPEQLMQKSGLSEWQKQVLFTTDRDKIAEAVYWDIASTPMYSGASDNLGWPEPGRAILGLRGALTATQNASLTVTTKGVRHTTARFTLLSFAEDVNLPAIAARITSSANLDAQTWIVEFDLRGIPVGAYLRLVIDDGSGKLVDPIPLRIEPA